MLGTLCGTLGFDVASVYVFNILTTFFSVIIASSSVRRHRLHFMSSVVSRLFYDVFFFCDSIVGEGAAVLCRVARLTAFGQPLPGHRFDFLT